MAHELDDLLEPGERMVFRNRAGRLPHNWLVIGWFVPSMLVLLLAKWLTAGPDDLNSVINLTALWGLIFSLVLVPFLVAEGRKDRAVRALVTDRRVLYAPGAVSAQVTEIPVAEVGEIRAESPGLLEIRTRDGAETRLERLHDTQGFATALAEVGKTRPPRLFGRLHLMTPHYAVFVGGGPGVMAAIEFVPRLILAPWWSQSLDPLATVLLALSAVTGSALLGFYLGTHLAGVLGLIVLRPHVTAEEVGNWLRAPPRGALGLTLSRWVLWKNPVYFRFASLLWGEPIGRENRREARHGN